MDRALDRREGRTYQLAEQGGELVEAAREAVELAVAKHKVAQRVSPQIAEARDATLKAMKETELGWQKAVDKIAERICLTKGPGMRRS